MTRLPDHVSLLERGLRSIFADRLESLVVYGVRAAASSVGHDTGHTTSAAPRTSTLAIVTALRENDLRACADRVGAWRAAGLATPLLLAAGEFEQSLDAFPLEFGAIIADYAVVAGKDPFEGLVIAGADIRRACEVQVRSHLLHLREGVLETEGNGNALAVLIVRSAAPFAALLTSVARLQGLDTLDPAAAARHAERQLQVPPGAVSDVVNLAHIAEISAAEATRIFPAYLDAVERLAHFVDSWETA